jgi:signal peptidase I
MQPRKSVSIVSVAVFAVVLVARAEVAASQTVPQAVHETFKSIPPGHRTGDTYVVGSSMEPTLQEGERLRVDLDAKCCQRGDIVVFRSRQNPMWPQEVRLLVKRVIALPGEAISECDNGLCIDGELLTEPYLRRAAGTTFFADIPPGCLSDSPARGCQVPPGSYFVMGDNRSRSQDSRVDGPIKRSSVVGIRR